MPKLGERKIAVCKQTGKEVEMEYQGKEFEEKELREGGSDNGHSGWLCLHDEFEEDGQLVTV